MKVKLLFRLLFGVITTSHYAQENPERNLFNNMLWGGYYNTLDLNSKWSIISDVQIRTNNWQENLSQSLIRSGLSYKLTERLNITNGFAYFNYFINNSIGRNEYRPWQEFGFNDKIWKLKISHRYRLEERINQKQKNTTPTDEYNFNFRVRYKIDLRYPLKKEAEKGSNVFLIAGNELMVNFGKQVGYNFFDQNRTSIGVHLELNDKLGFQFQYLRIWQQLTNGQSINNINALRFNLYHKIIL